VGLDREEVRRPIELEDGIVETDRGTSPRAPLIVLDRVEAFLDAHALGVGPLTARRIGVAGGSNFTFLLERGADHYVLRRPPRPPLPANATTLRPATTTRRRATSWPPA